MVRTTDCGSVPEGQSPVIVSMLVQRSELSVTSPDTLPYPVQWAAPPIRSKVMMPENDPRAA